MSLYTSYRISNILILSLLFEELLQLTQSGIHLSPITAAFTLIQVLAAFGTQPAASLGFSKQEYWSGLPFPSPMHESEK